MPPNIMIIPGWTMPPGGNQTQQGYVGPAGYPFPAHLEVTLPPDFAGAVMIVPNDQIPPFMTYITISAFSTMAPGTYTGGKLKVTGPDGFNWYDILIVVEAPGWWTWQKALIIGGAAAAVGAVAAVVYATKKPTR